MIAAMTKRREEVRQLKTTSMKVEPHLWREVRIQSLQEGRDTQDIVAEALRDYLRKAKKKGGKNG